MNIKHKQDMIHEQRMKYERHCCQYYESVFFAVLLSKHLDKSVMHIFHETLNPKVDSPPFAATAAALLQHYQVGLVHQPWGLSTDDIG